MMDRVWPVLTSHFLTHNNLLLFSLLTIFPSLFFSSPFSCLPFPGPISSQINNPHSYFTISVPHLLPLYPKLVFLMQWPQSYQTHQALLQWFSMFCHFSFPQCSTPSIWSVCFSHYFPLNICKNSPSIILLPITFSIISPCRMLHPAVSHGLFS